MILVTGIRTKTLVININIIEFKQLEKKVKNISQVEFYIYHKKKTLCKLILTKKAKKFAPVMIATTLIAIVDIKNLLIIKIF